MNAGSYITYVRVKGDSNHNTSTSINATVKIEKKALTLTVTAKARVYDGTTTVEISACTYSGQVGSETLTMTCTAATSEDKHVGTKNVSYTLSMGNGSGLIANYSYTKPNVTVAISSSTVIIPLIGFPAASVAENTIPYNRFFVKEKKICLHNSYEYVTIAKI